MSDEQRPPDDPNNETPGLPDDAADGAADGRLPASALFEQMMRAAATGAPRFNPRTNGDESEPDDPALEDEPEAQDETDPISFSDIPVPKVDWAMLLGQAEPQAPFFATEEPEADDAVPDMLESDEPEPEPFTDEAAAASDAPNVMADASEDVSLADDAAQDDAVYSPDASPVLPARIKPRTPVPEPPRFEDEPADALHDPALVAAEHRRQERLAQRKAAAAEAYARKQQEKAQQARYEEQLEAQRIQRIRRRRERRRQQRAGVVGGFMRTVLIIALAGGLASTIFTWFTAPDFITPAVAGRLQSADMAISTPTLEPTMAPTPNYLRRIGVVSGHRGPQNPPDPGAVCPDGLTEAEINFAVSNLLVNMLRQRGYQVDLLDEFDPRLNNYRAAALISIHANSCVDYGPNAGSGFLVSQAAVRPRQGADNDLAECIAAHYGYTTQLDRLYSLTLDMTEYHTFGEIHELTPAAIIELGFMLRDRELLTGRQELIAQGILNGVMCFLEPQNAPYVPPTATPLPPTATPVR